MKLSAAIRPATALLRRPLVLASASRRTASTADCQRLLAEIDAARQQPLVYHAAAQDDNVRDRPLVVLLGWMLGKQKHVDKYAAWYNSQGMDGVSLLPGPSHVLSVDTAKAAAAALVDLVSHAHIAERPLIFHGFSVGGFLYGCMLKEVQARQLVPQLSRQTVCSVFDSPVDVEGIPHGIAAAQFGPGLRRDLVEKSIRSLLAANRAAMELYLQSSEVFKMNPLRTPCHMIYSHKDTVADPQRIEQVVADWRAAGIVASTSVFADSAHVSHMQAYREAYWRDLSNFIQPLLAAFADKRQLAGHPHHRAHGRQHHGSASASI